MRKLVQVDGVRAILTGFTNVVTAQIPLADQLKVPSLSGIESPGVATKGVYSFAHSPRFDLIAPLVRDYWKAHKVRRVYALLANNALGQLASPVIHVAATDAGAEYGESFFNLGETDYRGIIARAKDANPDAILINGGGGPDEANVIRQLRELNMTQQLYTVANNFRTQVWRDGVGPYTEGMILGGLNVDSSTAPAFVRAYKAKMNGGLPGYQPGEYYDLTMILAAAFGQVGYDPEAVRNFVATLKNFPSVMGGTITMGEDHYTRPPIALWQVRRGQLVRL
jgi:ABC-type branched-subunit amino acid transport system substrate-binding protein